jgi:Kef-type K+ transport system membrane component KefB
MDAHLIGKILLELLIIIVLAKLAGIVCQKLGQSTVLGELLAGVIISPSVLNLIGMPVSEAIVFLAEFGIIILLFEVGLESNIYKLLKVGIPSTLVAFAGVIIPFFLGFLYFSFVNDNMISALFVGGTLTATSVGITSRILSEMKKINTNEGKIILGAAVIDDILGLIILSVLVGITVTGRISFFDIGKLTAMSVFFLAGSIFIGIKFAPLLLKIIDRLRIQKTLSIIAVVFAAGLALVANLIGLATIVGAFAAGLILETTEEKEDITEKIKPLSEIFVPVFFVYSGLLVDVKSFISPEVIIPVLILLAIAVTGKILSGWMAFGIKAKKHVIGIGMIPRGEVGLIFASIGLTNHVIDSKIYSVLVAVVILTTFIAPPLLSLTLKNVGDENSTVTETEDKN